MTHCESGWKVVRLPQGSWDSVWEERERERLWPSCHIKYVDLRACAPDITEAAQGNTLHNQIFDQQVALEYRAYEI